MEAKNAKEVVLLLKRKDALEKGREKVMSIVEARGFTGYPSRLSEWEDPFLNPRESVRVSLTDLLGEGTRVAEEAAFAFRRVVLDGIDAEHAKIKKQLIDLGVTFRESA